MITEIKQIDGYESMTAAQIADTLRATGVTVSPINRAALIDQLNKLGVLRKVARANQSSQWNGTALAMQAAIEASGNQAFIDAFDQWFSHITNPTNIHWDTTQPQWSAPFWAMASRYGDQPTMPTQADFDAIVALGGGWRFAATSEAEVTQAFSDEAAQVEADRLTNATALFGERIEPGDNAVTAGQKWLQAWADTEAV